jgi:hypothetical protein
MFCTVITGIQGATTNVVDWCGALWQLGCGGLNQAGAFVGRAVLTVVGLG